VTWMDPIETIFGDDGMQPQYEALHDLINDADSFLVVSHENPDGDAIGSTLAMCHLLWALGKRAIPYNVDPVPFNFQFLSGADQVVTDPEELQKLEPVQVTVLLDCAQKDRAGERFPTFGWAPRVAVVDHHSTWDPDFADVYVRDTTAAAVGEMMYRLALTSGIAISQELAECCYASIMTDTGGFRYGKTTQGTFKIASELVGCGVQPWHMNCHVYENDPLARVRLLGKVLNTLAVSDCGRLAFIVVDDEMLSEPGLRPEMLDGFINYARGIRGVEAATQLRQMGPDKYKVSFRSRGSVNVAALAESFGGGGHHNAAGCVVEGTADDIQRRLAARLAELL
jgi:bifunctional oligoribonuclease and PAP phosphatase NrnA